MVPLKLAFLGNCQAKALYEYFLNTLEIRCFFDPIIYHYILDDLSTWDLDQIHASDVFIYQDAQIDTLFCGDNRIDKTRFIPAHIAKLIESRGGLSISFPSIYFSAYFPQAVSSSMARKGFDSNTPVECFPNWTMSAPFLDLIHGNDSRESIIERVRSKDFIHPDVLFEGWEKTYKNLRMREEKNNVSIQVADWMRANWKKERLMHITNHPTKSVFKYLMNCICDLFDRHRIRYPKHLTCIVDEMDDTMVKCGSAPILPCVMQHCNAFEDVGFGWINGHRIDNWDQYIEFYRTLRAS